MGSKIETKLLRDSVHGYVTIPAVIFREIIDTDIFQRLRQIEQTSMRALFPSAHHDRFIHSIGVYHLGQLAYAGLVNSIKGQAIYQKHKPFWKQYGLCFQLACLLHDCAHAPMSHSFEYGYFNWQDERECKAKKERLLASMTRRLDPDSALGKEIAQQTWNDLERYFSQPKKIAPHEMVSALVAEEYYGKNGNIKRVLEELLNDEDSSDSAAAADAGSVRETISDEQLQIYIQFMQRAIIGLPYQQVDTAEDSFKNCLIGLLNGSFFDVDKLDYIVRDSIESGANNVSIDISRILNSLTLVEVHQFETETAVSDLVLNNSVYFTGCSSTVSDLSAGQDCECALTLKDVLLRGTFNGTFVFNGDRNLLSEDPEDEEKPDFVQLKGKRVLKSQTKIVSQIEGSCTMHGRFNGQIEMLNRNDRKYIDGVLTAKMSGKIKGKIIGSIETSTPHQITYEIGYLKNALGVIEDTLIARNRLYLWIYAHHKVTYHDYLLRNGVLHALLNDDTEGLGELDKKCMAQNILSQWMDVDEVFSTEHPTRSYLLNDGDLIHIMKNSLIDHKAGNHFAKDWFSRSHMYPIWKSYAEYNSFFINLSLSQRKNLWKLFFYGLDGGTPLSDEASTDEYENSILKQFPEDCKYVWIKPAGIKLKELDASNVYIVLSDNSVKRLKDVQTQEKVVEQYADDSFFYLYTSKKFKPGQKLHLVSFLKGQVAQVKK